MAYTSVIPVRRLDRAVKYVMNKEKTTAVSLQDALDYAANRDKTEQACFESSYACTLETAFADMRQTKERWHKLGGVQGYHLVQSFAAGEVTPELAHRIAKELADRVLGGRYEYVIGTHLNTGHIHSHIVWNSVSCVDGKKYRSNYKSYVTEIRAASDELCRKYKLSVIGTENSNHVAKPYAEWLAEKNGQPTWRTAIRQDVDEAIQQSLTWRQFLTVLDRKNFIRSYAGVCLQGVVIALSCIIFSAISSSPPAVDTNASVVTAVWTYVGELAFNLLVLVGAIKGCDRIVKEIMGL